MMTHHHASILLLATLLATLAGCGDAGQRTIDSQQQSVADVIEQRTGGDGAGDSPTSASKPLISKTSDAPADLPEVDIDLTQMSSTAVYATVADIVANPDPYVGKAIRMSGPYYHMDGKNENNGYFFVIIQDATACCAQGIEFVWEGEHTYPDDYPPDYTPVTVSGVLETYQDGEYSYTHLVDAQMVVD